MHRTEPPVGTFAEPRIGTCAELPVCTRAATAFGVPAESPNRHLARGKCVRLFIDADGAAFGEYLAGPETPRAGERTQVSKPDRSRYQLPHVYTKSEVRGSRRVGQQGPGARPLSDDSALDLTS